MDDLLKGLQMFTQGVKAAAVNKGIMDAQQQVQQIQASQMKEMERRQALQGISNNLALQLSGLGADPAQVAQSAAAIRPPELRNSGDFLTQAALTGDQEMRAVGTQLQRQEGANQFQMAADQRSFQREMFDRDAALRLQIAEIDARSKMAKAAEEDQELITPVGVARTKDDAKQLKEAVELKADFDNKIEQMIELRKTYGAEVANRAAVERGKQLSKDLLLSYKNLQKLGVLSKSDEDIINAIIPDDPLAFKAASYVGKDPISMRLQKFKEDSDFAFKAKVATRTKPQPGQQTPRADQVAPVTVPGAGQPMLKRVQDPMGRTWLVNEAQLKQALANGGKLLD